MILRKKAKHRGNPRLYLVRSISTYFILGFVLAMLLKSFVVQVFWVPSSSMEDSLQVNDRILVERWSGLTDREVKRGDVIVFEDPDQWIHSMPPKTNALNKVLTLLGAQDSSKNYLVKRVIGLPGDTVKCCSPEGAIEVNGASLTEPYLKNGITGSFEFEVKVPKGKYWVMGDNRNDSADSRYNQNGPARGFVDEELIVGRVVSVFWPLNHFKLGKPGEE